MEPWQSSPAERADWAPPLQRVSPNAEHASPCWTVTLPACPMPLRRSLRRHRSAQVVAAVAAVVEHYGSLDIVINNAGIGATGDVSANSDDEWHRVLDVNVVGIARVSRAALPHLRESARAAIVNTSSVVAAVGVPNRALYGASKGAVSALTLAMAADHVRDGIRVNAVNPAQPTPPGWGGCWMPPRILMPPHPPCAPDSPWGASCPPRKSPTRFATSLLRSHRRRRARCWQSMDRTCTCSS